MLVCIEFMCYKTDTQRKGQDSSSALRELHLRRIWLQRLNLQWARHPLLFLKESWTDCAHDHLKYFWTKISQEYQSPGIYGLSCSTFSSLSTPNKPWNPHAKTLRGKTCSSKSDPQSIHKMYPKIFYQRRSICGMTINYFIPSARAIKYLIPSG